MELAIYNSRQHQQLEIPNGGLKIGTDGLQVDLVIKDVRISDQQLIVQPRQDSSLREVLVNNQGKSIILETGRRIHGGGSCTVEAPAMFWIGETTFSFQPTGDGLSRSSLTTLPSFAGDVTGEELAKVLGKSPAATTLIHWLQSIGILQRSVGGSSEFFADAAHAVFDPGGLDSGMIINRDGNDLKIANSFISNPELGISFERDVVMACVESGQTVFHDVSTFEDENCQLKQAVVCAPIFDHAEELIGVVYGSRCRHRNNFRQGIRPLEAQFIQVVAECVTAGMVRLAQEADAARTRVQFEQIFSPKLVETLQRDSSLLEGHEREVTMLFCDMRGSTILTDQLPPRDVYGVLGDVLEKLTEAVICHEGVVIDYYGDGLAAFWNAPIDQPNHASLAVKAGLQMLHSMPQLNADWRQILGRNLQIGIGIHTGVALVGNSGSRLRMKYGPRGRNVSLACRIESATKDLGIPLLISECTQQKIEKDFVTRRIFNQKLAGFDKPVSLFQPFDPSMDVRQLERLRGYEAALLDYDHQNYVDALAKLVELDLDEVSDPAIDFLVKATKEQIRSPGSQRKNEPSSGNRKRDFGLAHAEENDRSKVTDESEAFRS